MLDPANYPLTPEQFEALKSWVEHAAYVAAGSAVHQTRARNDYPERNARYQLTGEDTEIG